MHPFYGNYHLEGVEVVCYLCSLGPNLVIAHDLGSRLIGDQNLCAV
jgi:hypothetical protein